MVVKEQDMPKTQGFEQSEGLQVELGKLKSQTEHRVQHNMCFGGFLSFQASNASNMLNVGCWELSFADCKRATTFGISH